MRGPTTTAARTPGVKAIVPLSSGVLVPFLLELEMGTEVPLGLVLLEVSSATSVMIASEPV